MRVKRNGEQYLMDLSIQAHAAIENIPMRWTGSLPQTLEYYERHVAQAARFLVYRQFSYCQNHELSVELLANTIAALNALAAHVKSVKEAQL